MTKKTWTPAESAELARRYPSEPTNILAEYFGASISQVYTKAQKLGVSKSAEYLASPLAGRTSPDNVRGGSTRFAKGQQPWNKGTHFTAGGRSPETRFRPGHRGGRGLEKYQPIGTERISKDGYRQRKINDDMPLQKRWRGVHILVWEAANGPLPDGYAVCLIDGNKQNVSIENLELVSRAELMRRNTYHRYGKEIAALIQLRGAVTRQINRRTQDV